MSDARHTKHVIRPESGFDDSSIMKRAHSHNDYWQKDPLISAIRHGLNSVEVDVFPRDGKLLVAHTRFELDRSRTIENMYINPIVEMIERFGTAANAASPNCLQFKSPLPVPNASAKRRHRTSRTYNTRVQTVKNNIVNPEDDVLIFIVDLKDDAKESTPILHKALEPLQPYLSKIDKSGKFVKGKVTVLISGNRPTEESLIYRSQPERGGSTLGMKRHISNKMHVQTNSTDPIANGERYMFIDGRPHDINCKADTTLVPLVSVPWIKVQLARFFGMGDSYMKRTVIEAHKQGKRVRIWGAPNSEGLWHKMMRSNVDLLSIDDHRRFENFVSRLSHIV
eukprot:CAMPEP_0185723416 /NCGR_PEP_ID=MMETSP1171-20130828/271_1 /TAXON_ID=374046 /ORGANISM="Helicotheca tamensis, Strain CCMP826" /LENGTH=337 /DNA_ID=CAMNT_0028391115 /DNA_START=157 /DNA_END=1170 /DNA_ORIENTATION=+